LNSLSTQHSALSPQHSPAYVAEQFENDGSPVSTIVKGVKRAMAGEYSRELSAKVFGKSVLRYEC